MTAALTYLWIALRQQKPAVSPPLCSQPHSVEVATSLQAALTGAKTFSQHVRTHPPHSDVCLLHRDVAELSNNTLQIRNNCKSMSGGGE